MTATKIINHRPRLCSVLLVGTILGGAGVPAYAQQGQPAAAQPSTAAPAGTQAPAPAVIAAPVSPAAQPIRSIAVSGNQRLEPETVISYMKLRVGESYTRERLDEALRDLYGTELFADVQILGSDTGNLVIQVRENPVINRIILEGNKRIKDDKIGPEIKLAPRQIFTRTKARADVARIIELYRRQGRFAAEVEPKIVQLEQNRVDVVFEISEGPKSKVRQINILGNEKFSDGELRGHMATKRTSLFSFLGSGAVYDPDRLAYDQQQLRLFYLTEGYADFRVVSAVAELTPDRQDFIITYVVEEGERYKFGDVKVESEIRDLKGEDLTRLLPMKNGQWYNAKQVEDTVTSLNESAGLFGYAFADVNPRIQRDAETRTMAVTFQVAETPRVYVERVNINGNTVTQDKVIRREFRLAEGDPFNSVRVKRSRDRIQSLGYFQDDLEVTQTQGSTPDRVILGVDVEEKATGELQVSAGFSSLERFLVNLSIRQRNFRGKGQELRAAVNYSSYSKSVELGFTEPYLFDRNIAVGADVFRRDYSSFNYVGNERNNTYEQVSTGFQLRSGIPLTEYMQLAGRYGLSLDDVTLDEDLYFTDPDGSGPLPAFCDPLRVGRYLCQAVGKRTTSSIGYSFAYDDTNNRIRPTRGQRVVLNQDFAGLGGSVKYLRTRLNASKYWQPFGGFVFSLSGEGGYIHSFEKADEPGEDPVRLIDRFFLGEPQMRGFDIRGVGPRVIRQYFNADGPIEDNNDQIDDALGGRAYYLARAELEVPLSSGLREMGLRPSFFVDAGALFGLKRPLTTTLTNCVDDPAIAGTVEASQVIGSKTCPTGAVIGANSFEEIYAGNTAKPRLSVGFGVNWNSPFGPFRIDIAKALIKADGDDTKLITFNVGTAF
ncbi:outer membrane protein assembly factor BamA [Allosphingosinicella deserti]|uniref:outer membrane protein assembly factor BamA n=1 Tax=Allosphingosinicella deserti TaxID=2116704 RepID=UPI001E5423CE|nr:outer membrane protein assembly factor BamA [Sphingomonas deserti]